MRRLTTWAAAAVLPALMASALLIGCGGGDKTEAPKGGGDTGGKKEKGDKPKGGLTAVEATEKGTLKGKIKLAGNRPDFAKENAALVEQMKAKDEPHCLANAPEDQKEQQHWRIAPDGGIANVFVWLQPPAGRFFKIEEKDLPAKIKEPVVLDQPRCAFVPHAFVLFPSYRDPADPKKFKKTGQELIVKNSNDTSHNTDLDGGDDNPKSNNAIGAKSALQPMVLNPSPKEIDIKCTIHPWMNAYARAFDHPYATVTDKDGNFEIKDVPAGAEVGLVTWHEVAGYGDGGKDGKKVTLKAGENTENFELKAK
jgi:hypothetical protein